MLKKIVLGTVFVIFVGALITGAVIRTMDKTDQTASAKDPNRGNEGAGGQESSQGKGGSGGSGNAGAGTGQGAGENGGEGSGLSAEENTDHVRDTYSGVVAEVSEDALTIETDDGESILIEGRAWSYAKESGFVIEQDDLVEFEGFYEENEFKVASIENLTTSENIILRDADGRPSWAGGGRKDS